MISSPDKPPPGRYRGFSVNSVCWGYREIFTRTIEQMFDEGALGNHREDTTGKFFDLLRCADQGHFDVVLKEFLGALNPDNRWILDLPGVFSDVVDLGKDFALAKPYYGIGYFKALGEGGLGRTPRQMRDCIGHIRRLREVDDELAFGFLKGYRQLIGRLTPAEIERFVGEGVSVYRRNAGAGVRFMECELKSSEAIIRSLTQECRLADIHGQIAALLKALAGREVEVGDLGALDSDDLVERGSRVICMHRWLYLPALVRHFADRSANRRWYLLCAAASAACLAEESFSRIHGHPEFPTCRKLVGDDPAKINLFVAVEYARVAAAMRRKWPGIRRLLDFGADTERAEAPPRTPDERLVLDALSGREGRAAQEVRRLAGESVNVFQTASLVGPEAIEKFRRLLPGFGSAVLRPVSFMPDFLFPGSVARAPDDSLIADMKEAAERKPKPTEPSEDEDESAVAEPGEATGAEEEEEQADGVEAAYLYDEWSQPENDYYRDYCCLREIDPKGVPVASSVGDLSEQARKVRRVFERLKPELVRREKRLPEGDVINPDLLVEYVVNRRLEPAPKVEFYEKPVVSQRDLATLILMDVSGSTGESVEDKKVLDIEKRAALILGEGLASLGDRFEICGFSGNGRENCEYYVYKSMVDAWGREAMDRILAARPSSSTRIGVALRHSAWRLSGVEARQRLIVLVTDGKPMDSGYDPNTRYAQHDVRMAVEESRRQEVHVFCISTEENSRADMEIMFPGRRFAILSDMRRLPSVLPKLYVKLTV